MTPLEVVLIIILWLALGFFICHKAKWYDREDLPHGTDQAGCCLGTVVGAPIVFLCDLINRMFIQKWHDE